MITVSFGEILYSYQGYVSSYDSLYIDQQKYIKQLIYNVLPDNLRINPTPASTASAAT
jgi:hypothetical protein